MPPHAGGGKLAKRPLGKHRPYHAGMTTYFVSRHPGALAWSATQHLAIDCVVPHLQVGAAYWHLALALPAELRGQEINAQAMERLGAHLQRFEVRAAT